MAIALDKLRGSVSFRVVGYTGDGRHVHPSAVYSDVSRNRDGTFRVWSSRADDYVTLPSTTTVEVCRKADDNPRPPAYMAVPGVSRGSGPRQRNADVVRGNGVNVRSAPERDDGGELVRDEDGNRCGLWNNWKDENGNTVAEHATRIVRTVRTVDAQDKLLYECRKRHITVFLVRKPDESCALTKYKTADGCAIPRLETDYRLEFTSIPQRYEFERWLKDKADANVPVVEEYGNQVNVAIPRGGIGMGEMTPTIRKRLREWETSFVRKDSLAGRDDKDGKPGPCMIASKPQAATAEERDLAFTPSNRAFRVEVSDGQTTRSFGFATRNEAVSFANQFHGDSLTVRIKAIT